MCKQATAHEEEQVKHSTDITTLVLKRGEEGDGQREQRR
jgi:hypothetical protein